MALARGMAGLAGAFRLLLRQRRAAQRQLTVQRRASGAYQRHRAPTRNITYVRVAQSCCRPILPDDATFLCRRQAGTSLLQLFSIIISDAVFACPFPRIDEMISRQAPHIFASMSLSRRRICHEKHAARR